MAKLNSAQKSGSVGWSTFQDGPHGLIELRRTTPRNPRSPAQRHIRMLVTAFASGWRSLTEAQRATWRALASQQPGPLGGCQLYIKLNVTRVNCGLPALAVAPPIPVFGILVCTGLVAESTPSVRLTQVSATVAPEVFIVEACPPLSQGIQRPGKRFCQITTAPGHAGPGADLDITAAYLARFGAPRAGQKVFVRLSAMKDGFRDAPVQVEAIVAPAGGGSTSASGLPVLV